MAGSQYLTVMLTSVIFVFVFVNENHADTNVDIDFQSHAS